MLSPYEGAEVTVTLTINFILTHINHTWRKHPEMAAWMTKLFLTAELMNYLPLANVNVSIGDSYDVKMTGSKIPMWVSRNHILAVIYNIPPRTNMEPFNRQRIDSWMITNISGCADLINSLNADVNSNIVRNIFQDGGERYERRDPPVKFNFDGSNYRGENSDKNPYIEDYAYIELVSGKYVTMTFSKANINGDPYPFFELDGLVIWANSEPFKAKKLVTEKACEMVMNRQMDYRVALKIFEFVDKLEVPNVSQSNH